MEERLLDKIRRLPPEKLAEVADFIDFLTQRENDRELTRASARLSEDPFQKFWVNAEDADYDRR